MRERNGEREQNEGETEEQILLLEPVLMEDVANNVEELRNNDMQRGRKRKRYTENWKKFNAHARKKG